MFLKTTLQQRWTVAFATGVACALSLWGCRTVEGAFEQSADISKAKVKSVQVKHVPKGGLCPGGDPAELVAKVKVQGSAPFVTTGAGKGNLEWDNFSLRGLGGLRVRSAGDDMTIAVPAEVETISDGPLALRIKLPDHPSVRVKKHNVAVRFDCDFVAKFNGEEGERGYRGRRGRDSPYSRGDGGDGGPGGRGGRGGRAPSVTAWVTTMTLTSGETMLQACVEPFEAEEERECFVIEPTKGTLTILAEGGAGGKGGRGGTGGSRGPKGGFIGQDGRAGPGGPGGNGGQVTVILDPSAKPDRDAIKVRNGGGPWGKRGQNAGTVTFGADEETRVGGRGPRPRRKYERVERLFDWAWAKPVEDDAGEPSSTESLEGEALMSREDAGPPMADIGSDAK